MKKSNKITLFYVLTSMALFLTLAGGGVYGLYLSIGMNFLGSTGYVDGGTNYSTARVSNVSYQNVSTQNINGSSVSIIILSVVLIIISICDFVSMIKQISFFKQYKFVKDSTIVHSIEAKGKSKKSIIVFAFIIDIVSIITGGVGLFLTIRYFSGNGLSWIFYLINGLVAILSVISIILLVIKIKQKEKLKNKHHNKNNLLDGSSENIECPISINKLEYDLLKLKHLKNCRVVSSEEYEMLRKRILKQYKSEKSEKNYD